MSERLQARKSAFLREKKAGAAAPGIMVICFKDEFFYLPAFFDHYRRLVASHFVPLASGVRDLPLTEGRAPPALRRTDPVEADFGTRSPRVQAHTQEFVAFACRQ